LPGAGAGLIGGIASAAALSQIGSLPSNASLVHLGSPPSAYIVYLLASAALGAGFGVLVWQQRTGAGETLFWGLTYGAIVWFVGPLTLLPLVQLGVIVWDVHSAQEAFPSLFGHLLYGAVTGLALSLIRPRDPDADPAHEALNDRIAQDGSGRPSAGFLPMLRGGLLRGALSGLLAGWLLARMTDRLPAAPAAALMPSSALALGAAGGVAFALLYLRPPPGTGPALIRGMVFGFFWWVIWPVTLLPILRGAGLHWNLDQTRAAFTLLPPLLLGGVATAVGYQWLDRLAHLLFSEMRGRTDEEGIGTEGLRALGWGALAGLAGGVLFTVIMARAGSPTAVSALIGRRSPLAGFVIQLIIADLIGVTYGLLFRRQSFDAGSALGWGVSYGFFWWVLGALTLQPLWLGAPPQWTVEGGSALFGSLIGHLAYGAGLGLAFHSLEARHSPWWVPRTRAEEARVARRKDQLLTAAPALWALVVVIALALPVILSM
jgi:uncharacterized membrane protein YagU involved in acid resistance